MVGYVDRYDSPCASAFAGSFKPPRRRNGADERDAGMGSLFGGDLLQGAAIRLSCLLHIGRG